MLNPETEVLTPHGLKPIREIDLGDQIMTTMGFREVTRVDKARRSDFCDVKLSSGKTISCTQDQLFLIYDKVYRTLKMGKSLSSGELILCCNNQHDNYIVTAQTIRVYEKPGVAHWVDTEHHLPFYAGGVLCN